ncbi:hypothetical protein JW960_25160 [candidate division KSB1 bacterium]|nr:hypothetical protein [candidate division KSB1 bacterium]
MKKFGYISVLLLLTACAHQQPYQFIDAPVVTYYNDIHPIPLPESVHQNVFEYYARVKPPQPNALPVTITKNKAARDVNALDQIPGSSWFFPRLGAFPISPEELVEGPTEFGPPQPPLTVIQIRNVSRNPRLIVFDRRDIHYLLKFDPPDYPGISTTSSFIANRLFWGFGYHVPEDQLCTIRPQILRIDTGSDIKASDIDAVFKNCAHSENGDYRCIASRIIRGLPLGPAPDHGVRSDDPNDHFPHEDRRVLRALKVFAAFTNMADISTDNLFDIYVGEPNYGYIKHYLIDFDDVLGTVAARYDKPWAGFNHDFDVPDMLINFVSLGLRIPDWEKIPPTPWPSVGMFEATLFDPARWKETNPFKPIRYCQPADAYWAATVLAALTPVHIQALVQAADFPEPEAEQYMIKTLIERQRKLVLYYYSRVTPLDLVGTEGNAIRLVNRLAEFENSSHDFYYTVRFLDENAQPVTETEVITNSQPTLLVPIPASIVRLEHDYFCMNIQAAYEDNSLVNPAQFHCIVHDENNISVIGVVH